MDTSGTGLVSAIGYSVFILASLLAVRPLLEREPPQIRAVSRAAVVIWLVVAIPSLLQLAIPKIYDLFHRSRHDVLAHHEWWRVATSVVVQDGGLAGTAFNLFILAVASYLACRFWGTGVTVSLFVVAGIGLNLLAVAFGATDGGGNSGATFPLVASLAPYAVAVLTGAEQRVAAAAATVVGVAGICLVASNDGHGVAILLGLAIGLALLPLVRRRQPSPVSEAPRQTVKSKPTNEGP